MRKAATMETDFGKLVECILVEICARGNEGLSLSELFNLVESLYNIQPTTAESRSSTENVGSLEQAANIVESLRPISFHRFKNEFWQSLLAHPDVIISDDQAKNGSSFAELGVSGAAPTSLQQNEVATADQANAAVAVVQNKILQSAPQPLQKSPTAIMSEHDPAATLMGSSTPAISLGLGMDPNESRRIYISKDRLWRTLTGHDCDPEKIPTHQWHCLRAIAARIGRGIMEADLAQQVGPDKPSVIKLTKFLVERGYVEKRKVPGHGPRNCLLICKTLKTRTKTIDQAAARNSPKSVHDAVGSAYPIPEESSQKQSVAESSQHLIESVDSYHEPVSNPTPIAIDGPLTDDPTNSTSENSKTNDQLHRTSSRRSAPRRNFSFEYRETTPSNRTINSRTAGTVENSQSPHINISKSRSKQASFKTYDEYRREEGWPGVYFDLPNLSTQVIGRPRKRFVAVFKSNKLKQVTFLQEHTRAPNSAPTYPEHELSAPSYAYGPPPRVPYPPLSGTASHKISENSAQFATYRSPYLSPPSTSVGADTLSSKYAFLGATTPIQEKSYRSPYSLSASSKNLVLEPEPQTPSKNGVLEDSSRSHEPVQEDAAQETDSNLVADDELQAAIAAADNVSILDCTSRLASNLKDVAGNLLLSTDMKTLTFVVSGEEEATSGLVLSISDISKPPATSTVDALRPELLITAGADEYGRAAIIHRFRFLAGSMQKANNMRAKIVTAMTILEFSQDDLDSNMALPAVEKPFKCDICNGSWKNMEGIKYHKTKARVPCNPNFKPRTGSRAHMGRRNLDSNTVSPFRYEFAEFEDYSGGAALNEELPSEEDTHDTECDTDDQIAKNQEFSVFETPVGAANPGVDKNLATGLSDTNYGKVLSEERRSRYPFGRGSSDAKLVGMHDTRRTSRKLGSSAAKAPALEVTKRRKDVIMSMLQRNLGVFPGDRGLWYGFLTCWAELFPHSGLPHYAEINAALALLEDSGQVHKIQFTFKDDLGLMRMRAIIIRGDVDPKVPAVANLKEAIKTKFPEFYVPPEFAPPKNLQSMLDSIEGRPGASVEVHAPTSSIGNDTASDTGLDDDFDAPQIGAEEFDDADDDDYVDGLKETVRRSQRSAGRKAREIADYTPSKKHGQRPGSVTSARTNRRKLTGDILDDSDSDYLEAGSTQGPGRSSQHPQAQSIWQPVFAYIQDPVRSTWSLVSSKPRRKVGTRLRLPEPVTYLQTAENSAWSLRPFGHGVRPIFARPSKRSVGASYLEKCENGFRPILMPTTSKFARSPFPPGKTAQSALSVGTPSKGAVAGKRRRPSTIASQLNTDHPTKRLRSRKFVSYGEAPFRASSELEVEDKLAPIPDFRPREFSAFSSTLNPGLDSLAQIQIAKLSAKPALDNFLRQDIVVNLTEIIDGSASETQDNRTVSNKRWADYLSNAEKIATWEQGAGRALLARGSIAPDYYFINLSLPNHQTPSKRRSTRFIWSDRNTFTLDTLPYEELETDVDVEITVSSTRRPSKYRKSSNLFGFGGFSQKKTRRMTALPADVEGLLDVISSDPDLQVEIAYDQTQSIRKRTEEQVLSPQLEERILLSIIVIRTLTGGIDRTVDWVLVSRLRPEITVNFIQRRWMSVQQANEAKIEKLSAEFQDFYIQAYETGLVPAIDFDHLLDYPFDDVINLFENKIDLTAAEAATFTGVSATPELPSTRTSLNTRFWISGAEERPWRDEFFSAMAPVHKRMDYATAAQYTTPVHGWPLPTAEEPLFLTAKSWIRANSLTPEAAYNPTLAGRKLSKIPKALLEAATQSLLAAKILANRNKGRATPGRAFEATETFNSALRKHLSEMHFAQAVAYKSTLDAALRAGQDVTVRWDADEGTVLALTNMQAWDRIKIVPRNLPRSKFGLIPQGSYQTKQMDKKKLRFDMVVQRTRTYAFGDLAGVLGRLVEAPPLGEREMIPIWYDIHRRVIPNLWRKVLCAVLGTLAFRPGAGVAEIVRAFRPAVEAWEARVLMEWAEREGAVVRIGDGEREGWTVGEWWWLIGGLA